MSGEDRYTAKQSMMASVIRRERGAERETGGVRPCPHRGINKSAKSGFKTPGFINFRFSQDVKEVMR